MYFRKRLVLQKNNYFKENIILLQKEFICCLKKLNCDELYLFRKSERIIYKLDKANSDTNLNTFCIDINILPNYTKLNFTEHHLKRKKLYQILENA